MKILIIKSALSYGGVDQLVLNLLSTIDFKNTQIDIQYFRQAPCDAAQLYYKYPCNYIEIDRVKKGPIRFIINQYKIFKKGKYEVVHAHTSEINVFVIIAAKLAGVKKLIVHSHYDEYPQLKMIMPLYHYIYKHSKVIKVACSEKAGQVMYGKKSQFIFMKNGVDTDRFSYNLDVRKSVREELQIENKLVIGYIARMCYQKNHEFLLNVLKKILEKRPDVILVLIGDGELHDEIVSQIRSLGMMNSVIMLGKRTDVERLLQAIDIVLFPTRYEGLSLSLLEIQCSGLKCICSDVVPSEVKVSDNMIFKSLSDGVESWADELINNCQYNREDGSSAVKESGFGLVESAKNTYDLYRRLNGEK